MIQHYTFNSYTFTAFQKSKCDDRPCGDSYWLKENDDEMIGVIADGLGSGEEAHVASKAAVEIVKRYQAESIPEIIHQVNEGQAGYRGVVLSLIKYNKRTRKLQFCGIGNVKLNLVKSLTEIIQPLTKNGFLSGRPVDIEVHEMEMEPNFWLVMYSDGIDFRVQELYNLYSLFTHSSYEETKAYLNSTNRLQLNNDDVTIIIGKPH